MSTKINPYIIGFSDSVHDRSVCLLKGNELIVAIEEERLSRIKHGLPLYQESRTRPDHFSQINLESTPAAENEAALRTSIDYCLTAAGIDEANVDLFIGNSLHIGFPFRDKAVFINHHLAHACSAYYASGFDDAAILVADGYGDPIQPDHYETLFYGHGTGNDIQPLKMISGEVHQYYDMKNSLGVFYRIGTLLSGFGLFDEGKAMGLAAYGKPLYKDMLCHYIAMWDDRIEINNEKLWHDLNDALPQQRDFNTRANLAASFQALLNDIMLRQANLLYKLTGSKNLCIAGGVGLNCVANTHIIENSPFDHVFIFPAPGDNGISFGAAYYAAYKIYGLPRVEKLDRTNYGKVYTEKDIEAALSACGDRLSYQYLSEDNIIAKAAHKIAEDDIIMWFYHGAEIGPRALGFRSILANPARRETKDYINAEVKFREAFRPLAPIVLEECASDYFEVKCPSPFMLYSPKVKAITQKVAPAIVHEDGTARLQTVNKNQNPRIYALINAVATLTGTPIVLNTSFNGKDEPIVETPLQALSAFLASPVKSLFIENYFVQKTG